MNPKKLQELNEDLGTCTMVVLDKNTIILRDLEKHKDFMLQKCNINTIADKSGQNIYLIGGQYSPNRIRRFNIADNTFTELPVKLIVPRFGGHMCALIPNTNKIMITGGKFSLLPDYNPWKLSRSTEIFDTENESVTLAGEMKFSRRYHGIGVLTINDKDRLAVFGGVDDLFGCLREDLLRSVEVYNAQNDTWEISTMKMQKVRNELGFKSFKQGEISKSND